nr:hypothetical protein [Rhodococcus sp. (in: high G+C Gram-positive bacteria)]
MLGDLESMTAACRKIADQCDAEAIELEGLSVALTWEGEAGSAARDAIDRSSRDYADHSADARLAERGFDAAFAGLQQVKAELDAVREDASSGSFVIDSLSAQVRDLNPPNMAGWAQEDRARYYDSADALQGRVNNVLAQADRVDNDLAALIDGLSNDAPGLTGDDNRDGTVIDRHQSQIDAFRNLYQRSPSSVNDWRMAEALDPGTYRTGAGGAEANVVAGTIDPREGFGVVRTNLYIPGTEAQNVSFNPADVVDGRAFPNNMGDNRGPDPYAAADQSRVSIYVDYENGVVVARQNPTVVTSGPNPAAADEPQVRVAQAPDGSVRVNYFATDAYQPGAGKLVGVGVEGDFTMTPNASGNTVSVGGAIGTFPSTEIYQYHNDGNVSQLLNYEATGSEWGPLTQLVKGGGYEIGADVTQVGAEPKASPQMGYPGTQQSTAPEVGTVLGSPTNPPRVEIVQAGE